MMPPHRLILGIVIKVFLAKLDHTLFVLKIKVCI